jgi:hypothetical protein
MAKASFTKITTRITVDGRTYSSLEEMPADVRRKYEETIGRLLADRDGNGVPDVLETGTVDGAAVSHVTTTATVYEINGRQYASLDEVPPEFRELVGRLQARGPHDPSASPPNAVFPSAEPGPFDPVPPPGRNIHMDWGTVAWLTTGLALAAWVAYLIWGVVRSS